MQYVYTLDSFWQFFLQQLCAITCYCRVLDLLVVIIWLICSCYSNYYYHYYFLKKIFNTVLKDGKKISCAIKVQWNAQWRCSNANVHSVAKAFNPSSNFRVFASYFQSHQKLALKLAADSGMINASHTLDGLKQWLALF